MESLGKLVVSIFVDFIGVLIAGLLVLKFWMWFLHDMFDVFSIDFKQAIAVSFLLMLVKLRAPKVDEKSDFSEIIERAITMWFTYLAALGLGWIAHMCIS